MQLEADCSRCAALCCVVPAFARSADFAIDKPAGTPCVHLAADHRCGIHAELRGRGFAGCTAYDCFGAGQQVTQVSFGGVLRHGTPETAAAMGAVFPVVRQLHELLWYLSESERRLPPGDALLDEARSRREGIEHLVALPAEQLAGHDAGATGAVVADLLERVSDVLRAPRGQDLRRADLAGRDLRRVDLRGAGLRGAVLVGADLRGVDLRTADLLGADLRGARLHGAELAAVLFLTRTQVGGALGDEATTLPPTLHRPAHWGRGSR